MSLSSYHSLYFHCIAFSYLDVSYLILPNLSSCFFYLSSCFFIFRHDFLYFIIFSCLSSCYFIFHHITLSYITFSFLSSCFLFSSLYVKVPAEMKALQCMATLCSCLKYYGQAVIGVAGMADRNIIINAVKSHHHLHFFIFKQFSILFLFI